MIELVTIPVAALVNRVRGGGFGADTWPGHARLYAAPAMGLLALLCGASVWGTLAWAGGYLAWAALPLNRWDVLGRVAQSPNMTVSEAFIEAIVSVAPDWLHDYAALFVRELIGVLAALVAVALTDGPLWLVSLAPVYAAAAVLATEAAHWIAPREFRHWSEPMVGCLWGVLLAVAA